MLELSQLDSNMDTFSKWPPRGAQGHTVVFEVLQHVQIIFTLCGNNKDLFLLLDMFCNIFFVMKHFLCFTCSRLIVYKGRTVIFFAHGIRVGAANDSLFPRGCSSCCLSDWSKVCCCPLQDKWCTNPSFPPCKTAIICSLLLFLPIFTFNAYHGSNFTEQQQPDDEY